MKQEYREFHSAFGEDRFLVQNWRDRLPDSGYFVDVGAGDPFNASNTLHFERNGWKGLLIEADPRRTEKLRESRQGIVLPIAIGAVNGTADLYLTGHLDHASLHNLHKSPLMVPVEARRLEVVLRENGVTRIDLLSIDTEGTELDVWTSYSRTEFPTEFVIIEFETCGIVEKKIETRQALEAENYEVAWETCSNLVGVRRH